MLTTTIAYLSSVVYRLAGVFPAVLGKIFWCYDLYEHDELLGYI
jgi:hypothetical protein